MQKAMRMGVVTALLATAPVAVQAQGQTFVTLSAGQTHNSVSGGEYFDPAQYGIAYHGKFDKTDLAFGVTGGYRWLLDGDFSIGPEIGYIDLGENKSHSYAEQLGYFKQEGRASLKNQAALLGVNAKWMIDDFWSLSVRTGFLHTWTRLSSKIEGVDLTLPNVGYIGHSKVSTHDNGYYGAISAGYDFTRNTGVSFGYERYHSSYDTGAITLTQNIGVWTASVEYRFN